MCPFVPQPGQKSSHRVVHHFFSCFACIIYPWSLTRTGLHFDQGKAISYHHLSYARTRKKVSSFFHFSTTRPYRWGIQTSVISSLLIFCIYLSCSQEFSTQHCLELDRQYVCMNPGCIIFTQGWFPPDAPWTKTYRRTDRASLPGWPSTALPTHYPIIILFCILSLSGSFVKPLLSDTWNYHYRSGLLLWHVLYCFSVTALQRLFQWSSNRRKASWVRPKRRPGLKSISWQKRITAIKTQGITWKYPGHCNNSGIAG